MYIYVYIYVYTHTYDDDDNNNNNSNSNSNNDNTFVKHIYIHTYDNNNNKEELLKPDKSSRSHKTLQQALKQAFLSEAQDAWSDWGFRSDAGLPDRPAEGVLGLMVGRYRGSCEALFFD